MIVGLTGGIGSGKTAASDYFAQLGIAVVDADLIAATLTQAHAPLLGQIQAHFGDWVIDSTGNYNRAAMRDYLACHPQAIDALNAITHPAIRQQIISQLQCVQSAYAILSVPLLFESRHTSPSLLDLCQHILVIDVPTPLQIQRAYSRGNQSLAHIQAIIHKQISRDERLAVANGLNADIITNDGSLAQLHAKLALLHPRYLSMAQQATP